MSEEKKITQKKPINKTKNPTVKSLQAEMEKDRAVMMKAIQALTEQNKAKDTQINHSNAILAKLAGSLEKLEASNSGADALAVGQAPKFTAAKKFKGTVKDSNGRDVVVKFRNGHIKRNQISLPHRAIGSARHTTIDNIIADHEAGECVVSFKAKKGKLREDNSRTALQLIFDLEWQDLRKGKTPGYLEIVNKAVAA